MIVDAHAARPLAQGLVESPQQQQQLHMQVERPIDIAHLFTPRSPLRSRTGPYSLRAGAFNPAARPSAHADGPLLPGGLFKVAVFRTRIYNVKCFVYYRLRRSS